MSTLQAQTSFQEADGLGEVTFPFVVLQDLAKLFRVDNDIETANTCETELFLLQTSSMNLLPDPMEQMRTEEFKFSRRTGYFRPS